jgi:hypothetical protein
VRNDVICASMCAMIPMLRSFSSMVCGPFGGMKDEG